MIKNNKIPEIPINLLDDDAQEEIKKYLKLNGIKYIKPKVRSQKC